MQARAKAAADLELARTTLAVQTAQGRPALTHEGSGVFLHFIKDNRRGQLLQQALEGAGLARGVAPRHDQRTRAHPAHELAAALKESRPKVY